MSCVPSINSPDFIIDNVLGRQRRLVRRPGYKRSAKVAYMLNMFWSLWVWRCIIATSVDDHGDQSQGEIQRVIEWAGLLREIVTRFTLWTVAVEVRMFSIAQEADGGMVRHS